MRWKYKEDCENIDDMSVAKYCMKKWMKMEENGKNGPRGWKEKIKKMKIMDQEYEKIKWKKLEEKIRDRLKWENNKLIGP